jgi:hypothetical protein
LRWINDAPSPYWQLWWMTTLQRFSSIGLVAAVLLSGCAPARVAVKPDFWEQRTAKIGVALAPVPVASTHKAGAQGLLDSAINAAMAGDLSARLEKFDASAFEPIRAEFAEELGRRGMAAKAIPGPLKVDELPDAKVEAEGWHKKEFGPIGQKEDVDYLVLLSVRRLGTLRSYYGFIPLGAPKGFVEVTGQMVETKTNKILWQVTSEELASTVEVAEPWDQAPDFPNVTGALQKALDNGMDYLKKEYFAAAKP